MSCKTTIDQFTNEQWRSWASEFADHSIYQTWSFAELRAAEMGAEVSRLVIERDDTAVGMAQARIKRIPFTGAGVAYVFRGPLWRRNGCELDDFRNVLDAVREEYAVRRKLAVRLVPNMTREFIDPSTTEVLATAGFVADPSGKLSETMLLDLTPSLEDLRKGLAPKWRNHLNQSEKRELTIRCATDDAALGEFEAIYGQMWQKKQFETGVTVHSFRRLQKNLQDSEKPIVLLACADGKAVAGHLISTLGETCISLLAASNDRGRKLKASYLLQWRTVEMAKQAGAKWYDVGGIDCKNNPGVYSFKLGLNGSECSFLGQYEACCARPSRMLIPLAERARKALNSVRRATSSRPV